MKRNKCRALLVVFLIAVMGIACKKDSESTPATSTTVEYRITPMNNSFTKISFTDANGGSVVITDPAQFASGKKTVSVTSKPFHAKIETQVVNTALTPVQFTLTILVNGEVKITQPASVPASSSSTNVAEYTVQ